LLPLPCLLAARKKKPQLQSLLPHLPLLPLPLLLKQSKTLAQLVPLQQLLPLLVQLPMLPAPQTLLLLLLPSNSLYRRSKKATARWPFCLCGFWEVSPDEIYLMSSAMTLTIR
jgi:hypothetical protein